MLLASERSERDTYRGNTIENRGCLFSEASEASGADFLMSSRYIYIFRSRNCFCSCVGVRVYPFSYALARAG